MRNHLNPKLCFSSFSREVQHNHSPPILKSQAHPFMCVITQDNRWEQLNHSMKISSYLHIAIFLYLTDVRIIRFSHLYTNTTAVSKSQKD